MKKNISFLTLALLVVMPLTGTPVLDRAKSSIEKVGQKAAESARTIGKDVKKTTARAGEVFEDFLDSIGRDAKAVYDEVKGYFNREHEEAHKHLAHTLAHHRAHQDQKEAAQKHTLKASELLKATAHLPESHPARKAAKAAEAAAKASQQDVAKGHKEINDAIKTAHDAVKKASTRSDKSLTESKKKIEDAVREAAKEAAKK